MQGKDAKGNKDTPTYGAEPDGLTVVAAAADTPAVSTEPGWLLVLDPLA